MAAKLRPIQPEARGELMKAMGTVLRILGTGTHKRETSAVVLRGHRPGDMGWVVERHGVLYSREYGWDERFEALVAGIVSEFVRKFDPQRERCWIAERNGERVGSVFLVRKSDEVAKLRLLLVEPEARGCGLGRIWSRCLRFAGEAGYRSVELWTNQILNAARQIYRKTGFQLVDESLHREFGPEMMGETWVKQLTG